MCVPLALPPSGMLHLLPNIRSPVPQSRMNCVPSGVTSSRQGVFPPYLQVAGSTVGVEPRTPQKLSLAMGTVISLVVQLWLEAQATGAQRFYSWSHGGIYRQTIQRKLLS